MWWSEVPQRRRFLGRLLGLGGLAGGLGGLSGCGFQLRSESALPFRRLALEGASVARSSSFGQELRRQLGGRVQIVEAGPQAPLVLAFESVLREKIVGGLTASGLVRELVLRLRVRFRLLAPGGQILIDATDLALVRDMSTTESAALAKAREEDEIFRSLERDAVLQIIRRLEAVPPERLA